MMLGSAWTTGGFVVSQSLRMGSNLILAWLLAPEIFGVMAVMNIVLQGLQMFSDVGIQPSIVRSSRGDDPQYLNTAWTVQVIRGVALWAIACLLAWPLAKIYSNDQLLYLLPVAGVAAMTGGFRSTKFVTIQRDLMLGRLVILQNGTQVLAVVVMVAWALVHPSVWALMAGSIVSSLTMTIVSHWLLPGPTNRFRWEPEALKELITFGRWIFISTIITFLATRVDKLIFAWLFDEARMGVFTIAMLYAQVGPLLMGKLCGSVGFPALSDLYRRDVDRFKNRLGHFRLVVTAGTNLSLLALAATGPWLIRWLYPDTFIDAGWMLTALCVGALAATVNTTYAHAFLAMGSSFRRMITVAAQLPLVAIAMVVGYQLAGETGFVLGIAAAEWLLYPVFAVLAIRSGIWQPRIDLPALLISGVLGLALLQISFRVAH